MSLIGPIMVNNETIGAIIVTRREPLEEGRALYSYDWEVGVNEFGNRPTTTCAGELKHNYEDGVLVLLRKVLEQATR